MNNPVTKQYQQEVLRQPADFLTTLNNTFCFQVVYQDAWKIVINRLQTPPLYPLQNTRARAIPTPIIGINIAI